MILKSTISLMMCLIFFTGTGYSQPVSIDEAAEFAKRYFSSGSLHLSRNSKELKILDSYACQKFSHTLYYILNYENGGFILVSADQRFYPVLAYSFHGRFDLEDIPENCKTWMDWYEAQIEKAIIEGSPSFPDMPMIWEKLEEPVSNPDLIESALPLLTSSWSQFGYYNLMCPEEPESYDGHVPTGCVALAMAQLMYYYRFPDYGSGTMLYTPSYHGGIYGPQYVDFSASVYNWQMMTDIGHDPNIEIAELCYHAGVSVKTSYTPEASGADVYDVPDALRTHFCYLADDYIYRNQLQNTEEWVSMIIGQLDRRVPVLYRSSNGWSGHVYICDGYQDSTHFHFNWGWGGTYNGYYYIDELIPGGIQLNISQGAIFNIFPDTATYQYPPPFSDTVIMKSSSGSIDDGSGPFDYPDNLFRSWLIQPEDNDVTNIIIEFSMFDTEEGADRVMIYDGNSSDAPLLATFSGDDIPLTVGSSGPSLFLTFETDSQNHARGFHASFYGFHLPFCSGEQWFIVTNGDLDDGSRFMDYRNDTDCEWIIAPYISPLDSVAAVKLNFNRFDMAGGDTVYLYDGIDRSSSLLGKFSSGDSPGSIVSTGNRVLVRFITDHQFTAGGWEISWDHIRPAFCHDTTLLFAPNDTIEDGSGGKNYCESSDCYFLIDLSNNPFITVRFLEFELENNYDFLKFYDADHPNIHLYRFSGYSLPEDITFSVERLLIYFHSDERDNFSGWKLLYTASSAGIPELQDAFSIFPNPACDELSVHIGNTHYTPMNYGIYRPDGKKLLAGKLREAGQAIRLDLLSPGIYILALEQDRKIYHFKFIKIR